MLKTDVIIVGYGPTAAIAANLLGARGWRVDVFERAAEIHPMPRAVHFDDEVMRVLQQLGLADEIESLTRPVQGMDLINAEGHLLARYAAPSSAGPLGWRHGYMFHQPDLERVLRKGVARYPKVRVHTSHEVESIELPDQGVAVNARGPQGLVRIEAPLLLGCCGARSMTRAAIGGKPFDYGAHQAWILIDVKLLRDPGLPGVTVQYCDPARPSTSIPTPGATRRFELMLMPGETAEQMLGPDRVADLLSPWLNPADYEIVRAATYTFRSIVAEHWRRGPLLIAGDAAHLMPPFLGQGLCSGARDAINLSWKIDLVLRGVAAPSLLDTYQAEREPHVRVLIESDLWLAGVIQTTDVQIARQRDQQMADDPASAAMVPPAPALGGDLCGGAAVDRRPFPQPLLGDGKRNDARLGDGFSLVGCIKPSARAGWVLQQLGTQLVAEPCAPIAQWLQDNGAVAALVRPDRYVMATVAGPEGLDAALEPLARHLLKSPP